MTENNKKRKQPYMSSLFLRKVKDKNEDETEHEQMQIQKEIVDTFDEEMKVLFLRNDNSDYFATQ